MFGAKKQPTMPYVLQVLTTEYLIDGTLDGNTRPVIPLPDTGIKPIDLSNVKIQSTGSAGIPSRTCPRFLAAGSTLVALIPQVDVSQARGYEGLRQFNKPVLGVYYVGPYVMEGKLMFLVDNYLNKEMPMTDVRITRQEPGAPMGELYAPFCLVNMHWLHGYELR